MIESGEVRVGGGGRGAAEEPTGRGRRADSFVVTNLRVTAWAANSPCIHHRTQHCLTGHSFPRHPSLRHITVTGHVLISTGIKMTKSRVNKQLGLRGDVISFSTGEHLAAGGTNTCFYLHLSGLAEMRDADVHLSNWCCSSLAAATMTGRKGMASDNGTVASNSG